jgi:hypothetical protein
MHGGGDAAFCVRAEHADEVLAAQPMSELDATELHFLEQPEPMTADKDDR